MTRTQNRHEVKRRRLERQRREEQERLMHQQQQEAGVGNQQLDVEERLEQQLEEDRLRNEQQEEHLRFQYDQMRPLVAKDTSLPTQAGGAVGNNSAVDGAAASGNFAAFGGVAPQSRDQREMLKLAPDFFQDCMAMQMPAAGGQGPQKHGGKKGGKMGGKKRQAEVPLASLDPGQKQARLAGSNQPLSNQAAIPKPGVEEPAEPATAPQAARRGRGAGVGPTFPAWLQQSAKIGRTAKLEAQQELVKQVATAGPEEPLLARETAVLGSLMYKNNSQHRRTISFQHLRQVLRQMRQLEELRLGDTIKEFCDLFVVNAYDRFSRQVEVARGEAGVMLLHRLLAACRIAQASVVAIRKAASQTTAHLARMHFLKLHLVVLAILGRLQVLVCGMFMAAISTYNNLVDLVCMLPFQPGHDNLSGKDMPQMLRCAWLRTQPMLEVVPFPAGDGIPQQAARNAAEDPERDLLASAPLSREEALQEMARSAAEAAVRVAGGAEPPPPGDTTAGQEQQVQDQKGGGASSSFEPAGAQPGTNPLESEQPFEFRFQPGQPVKQPPRAPFVSGAQGGVLGSAGGSSSRPAVAADAQGEVMGGAGGAKVENGPEPMRVELRAEGEAGDRGEVPTGVLQEMEGIHEAGMSAGGHRPAEGGAVESGLFGSGVKRRRLDQAGGETGGLGRQEGPSEAGVAPAERVPNQEAVSTVAGAVSTVLPVERVVPSFRAKSGLGTDLGKEQAFDALPSSATGNSKPVQASAGNPMGLQPSIAGESPSGVEGGGNKLPAEAPQPAHRPTPPPQSATEAISEAPPAPAQSLQVGGGEVCRLPAAGALPRGVKTAVVGKAAPISLRPFSSTFFSTPIVALPTKAARQKPQLPTAPALSGPANMGSDAAGGSKPPSEPVPTPQGPLRPAWQTPLPPSSGTQEAASGSGERASDYGTPGSLLADAGAGPSGTHAVSRGGPPPGTQGRGVSPGALRRPAAPAAVASPGSGGGAGSPPIRLVPRPSPSVTSPGRPYRIPPATLAKPAGEPMDTDEGGWLGDPFAPSSDSAPGSETLSPSARPASGQKPVRISPAAGASGSPTSGMPIMRLDSAKKQRKRKGKEVAQPEPEASPQEPKSWEALLQL